VWDVKEKILQTLFSPKRVTDIIEGILFRLPYFFSICFYYCLLLAIVFFVTLAMYNDYTSGVKEIKMIFCLITYAIIFIGLIDLTHAVNDYHTKPLLITMYFSLWPEPYEVMKEFGEKTKQNLKEYPLHSLKIVSLMILMEIFIIIFEKFKIEDGSQLTLEFNLFILFSLLGVATILFVLRGCPIIVPNY